MTSATNPTGDLWIVTDDEGVEHPVMMRPGASAAEAIATWREAISPPPPPPAAADVRAEASRRMQALVGARDARHLEIVIANASREAIRLLRVRTERPWTAEEAARAANLEAADAAIEAIRAASNVLEAMQPVPVDFRDDGRWP